MRLTLGIREQLTAGIVLTTLAGIGLIGVLAINIVETNALNSKVKEAHKAANLAKLVLKGGATANEAARMRRLAASSLLGSGVRRFRLLDGRGRVVVQEGADPGWTVLGSAGKLLPTPGGLHVRLIGGGGWLSALGDALYVTTPVRATGAAAGASGRLEFLVPLADIKEDMAGVRKFLVSYALVDSLIIIVFGGFYLSRAIVRPVRRLEETATRIAGGRLGERAAVDVDNEIGSLARSFNVMAERLEEQIMTLERMNLELVSAQDELLRSKTLAAVGGLAAGIAHEIGNPLGAVSGYMELLRAGGLDPGDEREVLEGALREVSRIDSMVKEFLEIARPPARPSSPVDVARVVDETVSVVKVREDFAGVEIRTDAAEALPPVAVEEGKLKQVFMNLLINAAHAVASRDGERVISVAASVETRPAAGAAAPRRRKDDPPAPAAGQAGLDFVVVRFTDTGPGISEKDAFKVFEPFFTTKGVGRGTGLGLFVSRSIVKAYGGEITFSTKPGEGCTFTVALPTKRSA